MKFLILAFCIILPSSIAMAASDIGKDGITSEVEASILIDDLSRRNEQVLARLLGSEKERQEYIKEVYKTAVFDKMLDKSGLKNDPDIKLQIFLKQQDIYLNGMVAKILEKRKQDYLALAEEQYEVNKDQFKTPRKIKIAQLVLNKSKPESENADKIKKIQERLEGAEDKEIEFHALVTEFSDLKPTENKTSFAGTYDKWLIEPDDHSKLPASLLAAFKLEKVGEITKLVESKNSYSFIKLMGDTPSVPVGFDKVKQELVSKIQQSLWTQERKSILESLEAPKGLAYDDKRLVKLITEAESKMKVKVEK